jgi:hypothetical protein
MIRIADKKQGSALIYVTVAGIVIALVLVVVISIFTYNHNRTINQKTHTQAYYTAQTLNARVATWLSGVPDYDDEGNGTLPDEDNDIWTEKADPIAFLDDLKAPPYKIEQDIPKVELGDGKMGSASVTIEYRDPGTTPDKFRNIRITTTAEMAGQKSTLSLDMSLQVAQMYSVANTDFDDSTPVVQKILGEIPLLNSWRDGSEMAGRSFGTGAQWNYFDPFGIQTPVPTTTIDGVSAKFTKMNPLNYCQDAINTKNFNMTYVRVDYPTGPIVDADLKVCFDYTDGPKSSTGVVPTVFPPGSELKDGQLVMFSYGGGATFPPNAGNDKTLTYYTTPESLGSPGMTYPYNIVIAPYLGGGNDAASQYFNNFFCYTTDLSSAKIRILNGVTVKNGGIYTKRSAEIGATQTVNGSNMLTWNQTHPMIFDNSQMVFADSGEGQDQRDSIIHGYNATNAYASLDNGNVLVQRRHKLTIADPGSAANSVRFNCGAEKGITVESGGELVINSGANITSNIYVQNGATLTINGGTITGNIYCSGTLNLNGSFTQNHLDTNQDNIDLGYISTADLKGTPANLSGTYIFAGATTFGTLNIATSPSIPEISGDGGKIHTFVTPTLMPDTTLNTGQASGLFAAGSDTNSHISKEFETGYYAWAVVPSSNKEG